MNSNNSLKNPEQKGRKTKRSFKWPSFNQWKKLPEILSNKEKVATIVLLLVFIFSSISLGHNYYLKNTVPQPAPGGIHIEGVIGQPRFINPIYLSSNDVDRDLVNLIFAGLMKYDQKGKVVPDLAKNYEVKENGKEWTVVLKDNIFWQDGEPITAEDVAFTIHTIQNSDYKSPQRVNWLGVEVAEVSKKKITSAEKAIVINVIAILLQITAHLRRAACAG